MKLKVIVTPKKITVYSYLSYLLFNFEKALILHDTKSHSHTQKDYFVFLPIINLIYGPTFKDSLSSLKKCQVH